MVDVPKLLEELKDIDAKKAANTQAKENLANTVTDSAITELDAKFSRHSKINNYAINALLIGLVSLAGLSITGYIRLDDKINSESQFLSQRLDNLQQFSTQRLDEQSRFTTQRIDEERRLNTERLDNVTQKTTITAPIEKQLIQSK